MSLVSIQGPKRTSAATVAAIFGMKVSVISWIWVSAWKTLTARPATSPKSSTGPASARVSSSPLRPSPMTVSTPISVEALHHRRGEHVPPVDEHEEHELEGQRDERRGQRDHAHRGEDRGHHHVEDQKRDVDQEPHLERGLELGDQKRGHERLRGHVRRGLRSRRPDRVDEEREVLLAGLPQHELPQRVPGAGECFAVADLLVQVRLERLRLDAGEDRPHHEERQEERERDHDLVGRHRLHADRLAEEREHDHDAHEGGERHEDRRRERQHRQQRDDLERRGDLLAADLERERRRRVGRAGRRRRGEERHERHAVAREPEQEPLALDLDDREKALAAEIAAGDEADRLPLAPAAAGEPAAEEREGERQRAHGERERRHLSPVIRSEGLITSVSRTPKRSFTITASPRAMGLPLTNTSSGSPASLSSSTTEPGASASSSRSAIRVRPISTVTSSGMSSRRSRFRGGVAAAACASPVSPVVSGVPPSMSVPHSRAVMRTAFLPPATPGAPKKRALPATRSTTGPSRPVSSGSRSPTRSASTSRSASRRAPSSALTSTATSARAASIRARHGSGTARPPPSDSRWRRVRI